VLKYEVDRDGEDPRHSRGRDPPERDWNLRQDRDQGEACADHRSIGLSTPRPPSYAWASAHMVLGSLSLAIWLRHRVRCTKLDYSRLSMGCVVFGWVNGWACALTAQTGSAASVVDSLVKPPLW